MKILYVGSEVNPFCGTGGLGDVLGSLPAALAQKDEGIDVRVVMPLYSAIPDKYRSEMEKVCEFTLPLAWRNLYCGIWKIEKDKVTYYFIDNEYYFKRAKIYGEYDDGERFAYFCKAVLEMLPKIGFIPDILHANDWQSALAVIYAKTYFQNYGIKCIYTIHNIEYQGKYGFAILGDVFALGPEHEGLVGYGDCINLAKGAIVASDVLTTVSAKYAQEIKDHYYAHGLAPIINTYKANVRGIVNGIDYTIYDPSKDDSIEAHFSASRPANKKKCKEALQKKIGLEVSEDIPLMAMVTRLVSHKGLDLVKRVIDEAVDFGMEFVILGTGDEEYESFFKNLEWRHRSRVRSIMEFNKDLAKEIYAGADMFLMPSKSEPCGLAQMIASRYGTVPIVRYTGGLADTIAPFDPTTFEGNGINFYSYNAHDMLDAIRRANAIYNNKDEWKALRKNAMKMDFSWDASASKYLDLYKEIIQ